MKQKRLLPMIAGCVIFLFIGLIYAWTTFSLSISQEFTEWTQAELSVTFTLIWIFFCVGGLLSGYLANKLKPTTVLIGCAFTFLAGFLLAANTSSLYMLYLGFGIMGGFATGVSYNTVISTVTKWFPSRPGLCSGILLTTFGLSSFVIGNTYQALTPAEIGSWRTSFTVMGITVFAVLVICSIWIKLPGPDFKEKAAAKKQLVPDQNTKQMLKTSQFWIFYLWATLFILCGSGLIAHASRLAIESNGTVDLATVALVASIIPVCNGASRSAFGWLFDRFGKKVTMLIVTSGFMLSAILLIVAIYSSNFVFVILGFIAGGVAYGGLSPCISAFISSTYGQKYYSVNFSVYNTNLIPASFGSTLAGALYDSTSTYATFCYAIIIMALIGYLFIGSIILADKRKK